MHISGQINAAKSRANWAYDIFKPKCPTTVSKAIYSNECSMKYFSF